MVVFLTMLAVVVLIFCIRMLQKHLHEAKLLRFREMAHIERMKALERDLPLPAEETDVLSDLLRGGTENPATFAEARAARERLVSLAALCLGLTTLLGGIGLTIGLAVQADLEIAGMYGIGLLPTFIGIGLLIFVRLTKQIEQSSDRPLESE